MTVSAQSVDAFTACLLRRDHASATALALGLADGGAPVSELLVELVGAAQARVGDAWQRNEVTVADEHAATVVSDAVVTLLAARTDADLTGPHVVVACAEDEEHVLPARLAAEVLQAAGFAVTFLGEAMPAVHLGAFLGRVRPVAVGISCSTPLAFPGLLSCIAVAHDIGIPVIAGGLALGPDAVRAQSLGADLFAPDMATAIRLLRRPLPTRLVTASAPIGDVMTAALHREQIVTAAMGQLARRLSDFAAYTDRQREETRKDLAHILQFAEASALTGDRRVFTDFLGWLEVVLEARGVPRQAVTVGLNVLADETADFPESYGVLRL